MKNYRRRKQAITRNHVTFETVLRNVESDLGVLVIHAIHRAGNVLMLGASRTGNVLCVAPTLFFRGLRGEILSLIIHELMNASGGACII